MMPLGDIKSFAKNNLLGPKLRRSFLSQVSNPSYSPEAPERLASVV
jgi:hypothetical protein